LGSTFGDVSKSLEIVLFLKGTAWNRPNDIVGPANMLDGLGHAQREFFNEILFMLLKRLATRQLEAGTAIKRLWRLRLSLSRLATS
jgi:hypothetical protein